MKRMVTMLIVCAMLSLLLIVLIIPARAESATVSTQAYDWTSLGTIAGATAAVLMIVQYIKAPLDRLWKLPTRLVVYVFALMIMLLAQYFAGGGLTAEGTLLAAINAVMVALAAYGAYEMTFKKTEES